MSLWADLALDDLTALVDVPVVRPGSRRGIGDLVILCKDSSRPIWDLKHPLIFSESFQGGRIVRQAPGPPPHVAAAPLHWPTSVNSAVIVSNRPRARSHGHLGRNNALATNEGIQEGPSYTTPKTRSILAKKIGLSRVGMVRRPAGKV